MAPEPSIYEVLRRLETAERQLAVNSRRLDAIEALDLARFVTLQGERMSVLTDAVRDMRTDQREDSRQIKSKIDGLALAQNALEGDQDQRAGRTAGWKSLQSIIATVVSIFALVFTAVAFYISQGGGGAP